MTPSTPIRARIGITWRTSGEEAEQNRPRIQSYEEAVREVGAEPVLLPLGDPAGLAAKLDGLDGLFCRVVPPMSSPVNTGPGMLGFRNRRTCRVRGRTGQS